MPGAADDGDDLVPFPLRPADLPPHVGLPELFPATVGRVQLGPGRADGGHRLEERLEQIRVVGAALDLLVPPLLAVRVARRRGELSDGIDVIVRVLLFGLGLL